MTFADVGTALTGDNSLQPSAVIVTYLSLAYLAVSCEITGLFSWLALHAARWTRGRPLLLLVAFFGLSGALTAATGPDVSLIALTPMVIYAAGASQLDPMAMAATHLGAASVWSLLVPVAGTANIITSHAFGITWMRFLGWMLLPTCAAAAVVFGLLYLLLHRRRLVSAWLGAGATAALPYPDPGVMLHDQVGAACNSALLVGCLLALTVAPWLRWSGWLVAAVFGAVAALYNLAASAGPLRSAIGRRSAYERRRRLQAELAQQGLHRLVSDEDLADLLLSAAQHRQASFTRLAAATANRVNAAAAATSASLPLASARSAYFASLHQTSWQHQQPSMASNPARQPSGSGWGLGGRRSSSSSGGGGALGLGGNSLGHSPLPSMASLGGSGSGLGSSSGMSPVRHWFSRRWSSLRGFALPPVGSTELVEAAADAGADLGILGHCGVVPPPPPTTTTAAVTARNCTAAGNSNAAGTVAAAGQGPPLAAAGVEGGAVSGPDPPRVSTELRQLLTQGTSAAPDTLEWWAAAAMGAQEMLRARAGLAGGSSVNATAATTNTSTPAPLRLPLGPSRDPLSRVDEDGCGSGDGGVGGGSEPGTSRGSGDPGSAWAGFKGYGAGGSGGGSLTSESPFADPTAMWSQAWDGRLASASACWEGADADARQTAGATGGCGSGCGGALARAGSHRRQRSYESVSSLAKQQRGWGGAQSGGRSPSWAEDPRDTCGTADSGTGGSGCLAGGGRGRWKGSSCGGGRFVPGPPSSRAVFAEAGLGSSGGAAAPQVAEAAGSSAGDCAAAPASFVSPGAHPCRQPDQRAPCQPAPPRPPRPPSQPSPDVPHSSRACDTVPDGKDDLPSACGSDPLAAALLPPSELSDVAAARGGGGGGNGWPLQGGGCTEPPMSTPPPLPRRPTLPSTPGFEGLFGCWRPDADPDSSTESAALLPGRAAASDDPRHTAQVRLPPLPPLPPASLSNGECSVAALEATPRGASSAGSSYHGNGLAGPAGGRPARPSSRSPFAFAVTVSATGARVPSESDVSGGGAEGWDGTCGSGCAGTVRCESFSSAFGGGLTSRWGWGQRKMRRPSVALLMLGPGEVSFLGTFLALPWANAVFLLGWFVLVEALQVHGWLDALARFLNALTADAGDPEGGHLSASAASGVAGGSSAATVAGAVFAVGWLSALLSVGMTGQSAALLLSRVMMRPGFLLAASVTATAAAAASAAAATTTTATPISTDPADLGRGLGSGAVGDVGAVLSASQLGARLALVVATNLAPALSLSGSLVALRWGLGLRELGVQLRCCKYVASGLVPAAVTGTAAALLVLWAQCLAWG